MTKLDPGETLSAEELLPLQQEAWARQRLQ